MRAILKPVVVPELGMVMFRPGARLLPLFCDRVLIDRVPEHMTELPSGELPAARQTLTDDGELNGFFDNEKVIRAAGGINSLELWLMQQPGGCQWPHSDYHHRELKTARLQTGALKLCWYCDNRLDGHYTGQLVEMVRANVAAWIIETARISFGFDESHVLTLPELCWWATKLEVVDALPEGMARRALRMPQVVIQSVTRESDATPELPATVIVQEKAKRVLSLKVDPETPESFMLRPKRRRWTNEKYTRWVKQQTCACCNQPADDPHHITGLGLGGMATKAHDLFVIPLCRAHHDELHADTAAFEQRYGTQPEMLLKTLDRALAIGVLA